MSKVKMRFVADVELKLPRGVSPEDALYNTWEYFDRGAFLALDLDSVQPTAIVVDSQLTGRRFSREELEELARKRGETLYVDEDRITN